MSDCYPPEKRSDVMRQVRGTNTTPEKTVRSLLHHMGYRFRLHSKDLPGKPDICFRKRRKVIFVHGCFWHAHPCLRGNRIPKQNTDYWVEKRARNEHRDVLVREQLITLGWDIMTIWECEIRDADELSVKLKTFLGAPGHKAAG